MKKQRPKCKHCDKNQYSIDPPLCWRHWQEYAKVKYARRGVGK